MRTLITEYEGNSGTFFQKQAQKAADSFADTVVVDGIPRWPSNNQIPPKDLLQLWRHCKKPFDYAKTFQVYEEEMRAAMEAYRQNQVDPDEEALYEMRAAFGAGETVVDVITGRRIKL